MPDPLTPEQRRSLMRRIRSKDTAPELTLRRWLFSMGYRYTLHSISLPGRPDIVFRGRKCVIFVHGCWWHGHRCKRGKFVAATRREFWRAKLIRNKVRDRKQVGVLRKMGLDSTGPLMQSGNAERSSGVVSTEVVQAALPLTQIALANGTVLLSGS